MKFQFTIALAFSQHAEENLIAAENGMTEAVSVAGNKLTEAGEYLNGVKNDLQQNWEKRMELASEEIAERQRNKTPPNVFEYDQKDEYHTNYDEGDMQSITTEDMEYVKHHVSDVLKIQNDAIDAEKQRLYDEAEAEIEAVRKEAQNAYEYAIKHADSPEEAQAMIERAIKAKVGSTRKNINEIASEIHENIVNVMHQTGNTIENAARATGGAIKAGAHKVARKIDGTD